MRAVAIIATALAMPMAAQAAENTLPATARHCIEALLSAQALQTGDMQPVTPDEAGRPKADPRSKLFLNAEEQVVFGQLDLAGRRACVVAPHGDGPAWPMEMINATLQEIGLVHAEACSSDEAVIWFSTGLNEAKLGVTTAVIMEQGAVKEIMAFETKSVSKAEDCADAGRD